MKTKRSPLFAMNYFRFNTLCLSVCCLLMLPACAYRFGGNERKLPVDNVGSVAIPQFKNKSMETGIEVFFTNAMRDRFNRYPVARVEDEKYADALLIGTVTGVSYTPGAKQTSTYDKFAPVAPSAEPFLPLDSVLAAEYRIVVNVYVKLVDRESGRILWDGNFSNEATYSAPQVTLPGVNTVDPLYNLSARRSNIQNIASSVIEEAFNRMTETF